MSSRDRCDQRSALGLQCKRGEHDQAQHIWVAELEPPTTYEQLAYLLLQRGHLATLTSLQDAVEREAELISASLRETRRLTAKVRAHALELARQRYTDDVAQWLTERGKQLTPRDVIEDHRTALAWGIATLLRGE